MEKNEVNILLVNQIFYPEPNHIKGLEFAKELVKKGHNVEILTGFPCYPLGKIYDGYINGKVSVENIDGINIIRTYVYPSYDKSAIKRFLNYFSLSVSNMLFGLKKISRPDIIHVYQGPITLGLQAFASARKFKSNIVWDIQDLWPESLVATGMFENKLGLKIVEWICRNIYKKSDCISVISHEMKSVLIEKGVNEAKIEVVYNWANENLELEEADSIYNAVFDNKFNIVYAGNMGRAQALSNIVKVAVYLKEYKDIQFVLIGDGSEKDELINMISELKLKNILLIPRQKLSVANSLMKKADILLVNLAKDSAFDYILPQKIQAYKLIGKAIISASGKAANRIIEKAGCGYACEQENPNELAKSILKMKETEDLNSMGNKAREYYNNNLSFESGVNNTIKIYEKVLCNKQ